MSAPPEPLLHETYLGDGVYAGIDTVDRLWIYLYDGYEKSSAICFEPEVLDSLERFVGTIFPKGKES